MPFLLQLTNYVELNERGQLQYCLLGHPYQLLFYVEEGANRTWGELPGAGEHALDAAAYPRFPERRWQGAGTAIPVFSLRTEEDFGVGEFYDLKRLIDWAAATGQCVIQVLPGAGYFDTCRV